MALKVSPAVVWRAVDGDLVLFHSGTESYYGLNEAASEIWRLLASGRGTEEVVEELLATFDVEPTVAVSQVQALTDDLIRTGLLMEAE